jgi:hypothetical protein
MSTSRNAMIVAIQVLAAVPKEQDAFRKELSKVIEDFAYKAPESLQKKGPWILFQRVMYDHIISGDEPWKQTCIDIFVGTQI